MSFLPAADILYQVAVSHEIIPPQR